MKRVLILLSIVMLMTLGCRKTDTKSAGKPVTKPISSSAQAAVKMSPADQEKTLIGTWNSPTSKGFVAEFKNDHKGATITTDPANSAAPPAVIPFTWTVEKDGTVKITEGKKTITGKLAGTKLEVDLGGAKSVLEKAK